MVLQCWTKFFGFLVRRSIRMVHDKNYETISIFVKVIPRILSTFFQTRCIMKSNVLWSKCQNVNFRQVVMLGQICKILKSHYLENYAYACTKYERQFLVDTKTLCSPLSTVTKLSVCHNLELSRWWIAAI